MRYIPTSLGKEEVILYAAHIHWIGYVSALFIVVIGVWLMSHGASLPADEGAGWTLIGLAAILIGIIRFIGTIITNKTTELAIINRKVVGKWGLIARRTLEQRLEKVDSVQVNQGIVGRLLNYGTIIVHGSGLSATPIRRIADPLAFRRQVENALEALKKTDKAI